MKLPAPSLGRQASTRGQDFSVLAHGVELLQLRPRRARSGAGAAAEMMADDRQSLSFFEIEMTNKAMKTQNNIIANMKLGALMR